MACKLCRLVAARRRCSGLHHANAPAGAVALCIIFMRLVAIAGAAELFVAAEKVWLAWLPGKLWLKRAKGMYLSKLSESLSLGNSGPLAARGLSIYGK